MATDDVYLCRLELTTWDVNHSISFHVKDVFGQAEGLGAIQLAIDADANLTNLVQACLAPDTILEAWYALRVNTPENPGLQQLDNIVGNFPTAADSYPPNTCAVFSFRGEDPQLKRAGRFYLGGLPKIAIEGGRLDAAWLAAAALFGNALEAQFGAGWQPGVWRTVDAGIPIVPGLFVQHDEVIVDPVSYSQRRRTSDSRGMSA